MEVKRMNRCTCNHGHCGWVGFLMATLIKEAAIIEDLTVLCFLQ